MRGPFQTLPGRDAGLSYDRGALDYDPSTGRCVRADPLPTTGRPAPTTEVTLLCAGVELNLRFPGQYRDAETGLFYNYFRDYDLQTGRYVQSDPIGLAGGINTYLYGEGNPVSKSDPLGLWAISLEGYAPWGGGIVFGRDPNSGGGFFTVRGGFGIGGGIKWDPRGGRPGSRPEECDTGGWGIGGFGDVQFKAGPVQGSLQSNAGVNFFNQVGRAPNPYRQLFTPTFSIGDSWGIKAEAAAGGELTFFSPKNPGSNSKCGCP